MDQCDSHTHCHCQSKSHLQPYTYHTVTCISNPRHWLLLPHFIRLQCLPLSFSKQIEEWPGICSYLLLCSLFSQLHSPNLFSPSCRPKNSTLESSYTRQNQCQLSEFLKGFQRLQHRILTLLNLWDKWNSPSCYVRKKSD